jgi:hypothetical protein
MVDVIRQNVPEDDATEVRFGMRSVMIVMTGVALVLTVIGVQIRRFPADTQLRLSIYWGVFAALLLVMCLIYARRRYEAEKNAGRILFQFTPHSYFLPRVPRFAAILVGVSLVFFGLIIWAAGASAIAENDWLSSVGKGAWQLIFCAVLPAATGIKFLWWHRKVRFCENGVLVRDKSLPWNTYRRFYWDAYYRKVIVVQWSEGGNTAVRVPRNERERVEAMLQEKAALAENA